MTPAPRQEQTAPLASRRVVDLQLLRAIAASLVVVDHTFGALLYRKLPYGQFVVAGDRLGALGVAAFFILSGLLMVRQSTGLFAQAGSVKLFAWRRISRIVPLYWLATLIEVRGISSWGLQLNHPKLQVALSLLFVPNFVSGQYRLNPLLGQGWTLNYEMAFYGLFALALLLPLRRGLALIVTLLVLLTALAALVPSGPGVMLLLARFYTNPVLALFAAGVLLGWAEQRFPLAGTVKFPISPAWLMVVPAVPLLGYRERAGGPGHMGAWYFGLCGLALVVVVLCSLARPGRVSWVTRAGVLLGDASYATYLFHLFVYGWMVPVVMRAGDHFHLGRTMWMAYVAAAVVAANCLGLLVHVLLERPLMRVLAGVGARWLGEQSRKTRDRRGMVPGPSAS